jgi:hypothetical protein
MKDNIIDIGLSAGVLGLTVATINDWLAFIGFALAIPVALVRIYIGYYQAKEIISKKRRRR